MKKYLLILSLACISIVYTQEEKNVLFIGNSQTFVNDLPLLTQQMAASAGDVLNYGESTFGGYSYLQHLNNEETQAKIRQGNWDYVVMQGRSGWPSLSDEFVETNVYPYARQMNDSIVKYNPCAETVFYHTWGFENGYGFYCPDWPAVCTYEGMDDMLQLRYPIMATENEAILSPVGPVWRYLYDTSPIVINLFDPDGSHPSLQGSYAGALTFYSILFRKDPNLVTYNPGIFIAEADLIKDAVYEVAYTNMEQWFVGDYDPYADFSFNWDGGLEFTFTNSSPYAESYHWDFGDGNESTEENPSHTYGANGNYEVTLTVTYCGNNYVKNLSIDTNTLSNDEINGIGFKVTTNPVSNVLVVQSPLENELLDFSLIDLSGKVVGNTTDVHHKQSTIDVSYLSSGIYFLKINSSKQHHKTIKILVDNR